MESILARKTVPLIENKKVIENPALIQVKSIKKKYLDQIREESLKMEDSFLDLKMTILGRVDQWIVYTEDGSQLRKMSRISFIQYYVEENRAKEDFDGQVRDIKSSEYGKAANEIIDRIPQIFAD